MWESMNTESLFKPASSGQFFGSSAALILCTHSCHVVNISLQKIVVAYSSNVNVKEVVI